MSVENNTVDTVLVCIKWKLKYFDFLWFYIHAATVELISWIDNMQTL